MPHSAASDLGLHFLPVTHLGVFSLQWVNENQYQKMIIGCAPSKDLGLPSYHAFWAEYLPCTLWIVKDPRFFQADSEDQSDCTDVHSDLSLCWHLYSKVHFLRLCWICLLITCHANLMLSLLGKNFCRQCFKFFSSFSQKIGFDILCKLSPQELISMNCQSPFSG